MSNSVNSNRNNIVKSNLEGYNTLYKIDLNFDSDVTKMNNNVLSDYIVRVLGNHPYYVDVTNIVDLIVNENENTITVIVTDKEVQERILELTNKETVSINSINENIAPKVNNKSMKILNASINSRKYILETSNNNGNPQMYEYELTGFDHAKDLYHEETMNLDGNKKRHLLRNDNGNPYFYDEYMDSKIEYTQDNKIGFLNQRLTSLEKSLGHEFDPQSVNQFKAMVNRIPSGRESVPTKPSLNYSNINESNNLIPTNPTMSNINGNGNGLGNGNGNENGLGNVTMSTIPQRNLPIIGNGLTTAVSNNMNDIKNIDANNIAELNNNVVMTNNFEENVSKMIRQNNLNDIPIATSESSLKLIDNLNISEEELDKQLNNILNEINNNKSSKNYNTIIMVIIVVLVLILLIVIFNLIYKKRKMVSVKMRNN